MKALTLNEAIREDASLRLFQGVDFPLSLLEESLLSPTRPHQENQGFHRVPLHHLQTHLGTAGELQEQIA